jgi:hypothetical protein
MLGEIETDVAFSVAQLSVVEAPVMMESEEAVKLSITGFGTGAVTLTAVVAEVVPAELRAVSV